MEFPEVYLVRETGEWLWRTYGRRLSSFWKSIMTEELEKHNWIWGRYDTICKVKHRLGHEKMWSRCFFAPSSGYWFTKNIRIYWEKDISDNGKRRNKIKIACPANIRLQDYLLSRKVKVKTPCGCRGNCGRCYIKVIEGELKITSADQLWLSKDQLQQGYRLLCQAFTTEACVIEIDEDRLASI